MEKHLKSQVEYVQELKDLLPREAFQPAEYKIVWGGVHLAIILGCYVAMRSVSHVGLYLLISLVIGHSLACLGFLAHEISHHAVTRKKIKYPLEVLFWGMNLIPATMWHRLHNLTHHRHMNTPQDPDRQFLESEKGTATAWYTRIFYPTASSLRWNPVVGFHFVAYILKNIVAVFFQQGKPSVVPHKPAYNRRDVRKVVGELLFILAVQVGLYFFLGNGIKFLFASVIAVLITSSILMIYVFTNHFLNPIHEISDPLATTTSVKVPRVFDKVHQHFSYHTEHHIFPSMNSDYYPALSELLQEKYGENYHQMPIGKAWKTLWNNALYLKDEEIIKQKVKS